MTRRALGEGSGAIHFRPRNLEEIEKFLKFKALLARDNESYLDVFLPIIDARVRADNPQLRFVQNGNNLRLNKTIPKPGTDIPGARVYEIKVTCEFCGQQHTGHVICPPPSGDVE